MKNTTGQSHRRRGGHAAARRVPVCWSLDFSRTPLHVHIQVTTCVLNYDLHKIRLEPDLPERTIASVGEHMQILSLTTVFDLRSPNALFP